MTFVLWTDLASIFLDLSIPFAIYADISIYKTFGKNLKLCPIFLASIRNMLLINIEIYIAEIFIKDPANFGFFREFWLEYGWIFGKITYSNTSVWSTLVIVFALLIGVSRLWSVMSPFSYQRLWTRRLTKFRFGACLAAGVLLSLHIILFVKCRAFSKTNNSLVFNTVQPNPFHLFITLYVKFGVQLAIIICYAIFGIALCSLNSQQLNPHQKSYLWNTKNKRIVYSQILILIPKLIPVGFSFYANLEAFFPDLHLDPLNLDLYYLAIKFGGAGYGVFATIVILICFPLVGYATMDIFMKLVWTDYLSVLLDATIPFAVIADISIYKTFGAKQNLCPIFLYSTRNLLLVHFGVYLVEIFIKEPAGFGLFWNFWLQNGWWIGKLVFSITSVWTTIVLGFALLVAISRFWCVWAPMSYHTYWSHRVTVIVSLAIWFAGFLLTFHVFFFVQCRAYAKTNTSLTFNTVTPNIVHSLLTTYVKMALPFAIAACYAGLGFMLWRLNGQSTTIKSNYWNSTTKKIVISQILCLIPKLSSCGCTIYSNLQAFYPNLNLIPLNLDFYYLMIQFGSVGYGIFATFVILFIFPLTWLTLKQTFIYPFLPAQIHPQRQQKEFSSFTLKSISTNATSVKTLTQVEPQNLPPII